MNEGPKVILTAVVQEKAGKQTTDKSLLESHLLERDLCSEKGSRRVVNSFCDQLWGVGVDMGTTSKCISDETAVRLMLC